MRRCLLRSAECASFLLAGTRGSPAPLRSRDRAAAPARTLFSLLSGCCWLARFSRAPDAGPLLRDQSPPRSRSPASPPRSDLGAGTRSPVQASCPDPLARSARFRSIPSPLAGDFPTRSARAPAIREPRCLLVAALVPPRLQPSPPPIAALPRTSALPLSSLPQPSGTAQGSQREKS